MEFNYAGSPSIFINLDRTDAEILKRDKNLTAKVNDDKLAINIQIRDHVESGPFEERGFHLDLLPSRALWEGGTITVSLSQERLTALTATNNGTFVSRYSENGRCNIYYDLL